MAGDSRLDVGSAAWCDRAATLTSGLPHLPGRGYRVQHDALDEGAGHRRWHQVVEEGHVVAWSPGDVDDPDIELRWGDVEVAAAVYRGDVSGTDALAAVRIVVPGQAEMSATPLELADVAELDGLPLVPGANLRVQYEFTAGPFGPVSFWMAFSDGRSTGMDFGTLPDPDATVRITFARMAAVRAGEMTVLQALEDGGQVDGGIGPLMVLAGLEESPELRAAELACGPAGRVLGSMGAVWDSVEHREAMAALGAVTR
jgi:hypothetical protein